MPITLLARPGDRSSAYMPLKYQFLTDKYPNFIAGETGTILNISKPTAAELLAVPEFDEEDVRVQHGTIAAGILTVGQHIRIESTTEGFYTPFTDSLGVKYGIFKVRKVPTTAYTVIDAAYNGDDVNGTIGKYYNNYHIKMTLNVGSVSDTYRIRPTGAYIVSSFLEDVQDTVKRQMGPRLGAIDQLVDSDPDYTTTDWSISANTNTHINYSTVYSEVYDIPNAQGVNVLTEGATTTDTTVSAINATKPYVHFRNGVLDHNYSQDYDETFLVPNPSLSLPNRFLTNAPRTQTIGRDQFAQLYVMTNESNMKMVIKTYPDHNAGGTLIGTTTTNVKTMNVTELVYVGTRHMGTGIITAATKSYTLEIQDSTLSNTQLTERRTYNIDDDCHLSGVQFFWQNQMGGIDQYTFTGHSNEVFDTTKKTFRKPITSANLSPAFPSANVVTYDADNELMLSVGARVNAEDMDWLKELFASNWVAIVNPGLDEFIPVTIMDQSVPTYDTRKNKYTFRIDYQYGFNEYSQVQ